MKRNSHGGPNRQQGRNPSSTALVYLGAKVERETVASIKAEAAQRGVAFNRIVRERLMRPMLEWHEATK